MPKRIVVGISGASGVIYGVRLLSLLKESDHETHLVISKSGKLNIKIETKYSPDEVEGMVVAPCTIKTLSGIANSYNENLLVRAADVTLKEKRKLVLVVRETPLHKGHLRLMTMAADMGAHILPPVPSFYHQPKTIDDIIDQTIGKIFDYLGIEHDLFKRWVR